MRASPAALCAFCLGAIGAFAHMEMLSPAPFRGKGNPNSKSIDYDLKDPLRGSQGLCKGYQADFADAAGTGKTTASWAQGSSQIIQVGGSATHEGGSKLTLHSSRRKAVSLLSPCAAKTYGGFTYDMLRLSSLPFHRRRPHFHRHALQARRVHGPHHIRPLQSP